MKIDIETLTLSISTTNSTEFINIIDKLIDQDYIDFKINKVKQDSEYSYDRILYVITLNVNIDQYKYIIKYLNS